MVFLPPASPASSVEYGGRDEDGPDDAPLTVDDLHPTIDAAIGNVIDERLERLIPRDEAASDAEDAKEDGPFELEVLDYPFKPLGPRRAAMLATTSPPTTTACSTHIIGITTPLSAGLTPEGAGRRRTSTVLRPDMVTSSIVTS
jgi:hypothetical protein